MNHQDIQNRENNHKGTTDNVNPQPNPNHYNQPNPSLLRINIDDEDKQKICIFWTILIIFMFLVAILSGYAIPKVFIPNDGIRALQNTNLKNCSNPNQIINSTLSCNTTNNLSYGQLLTKWNEYNQFIMVYLQIKPNNLSNRITFNQKYTFQLYEASFQLSLGGSSSGQLIRVDDDDDKTVLEAQINFDSNSAQRLYGEDKKTVVGYEYLYVIITKLEGESLFIKTNFSSTANFNNFQVRVQSYAVNQKYTAFTIALRYVFFFTSIAACFMYIRKYVKIPQEKKVIQQKYIFVASILLMMFNDPFYVITILKPNGGSAFFSILFIMNLIVFLILFWMVVMQRILQQDGVVDSNPASAWKLTYAILVWILLIVVNMVYAMQQIKRHPVISSNFSRSYQAALVILALIIFIGMAQIGISYVRICMSSQNKLWRSSIFMVLSLFVIIILFVLIITNSLSIYNYKGSNILVVYCLVNIYIYYLQFMFTITDQELQKIQNPQLQDEVNFIQMASTGTIDIVDVNLNDFNPQDKRSFMLEQKQDNEIYYKNVQKAQQQANLNQQQDDDQNEEQNQWDIKFNEQNAKQKDKNVNQGEKDQMGSFDFNN